VLHFSKLGLYFKQLFAQNQGSVTLSSINKVFCLDILSINGHFNDRAFKQISLFQLAYSLCYNVLSITFVFPRFMTQKISTTWSPCLTAAFLFLLLTSVCCIGLSLFTAWAVAQTISVTACLVAFIIFLFVWCSSCYCLCSGWVADNCWQLLPVQCNAIATAFYHCAQPLCCAIRLLSACFLLLPMFCLFLAACWFVAVVTVIDAIIALFCHYIFYTWGLVMTIAASILLCWCGPHKIDLSYHPCYCMQWLLMVNLHDKCKDKLKNH